MATALIVGASANHKNIISNKLKETGIFKQFLNSSNVLETLNHFHGHVVDMIFYYLEKSSSDNLNWFKELQKQEDCRDVPIMVVTETATPSDWVIAMEMGGSGCLALEISAQEMAARIRIHLRNKKRIEGLRKLKNELAQLALTDSLTGLYNRAYFDAALESECARSMRTGRPFSLFMIDVDYFKRINDTYGHQIGDSALQAIGIILKDTIRVTDSACRYGGEEFAVILPATKTPHAYIMASRIHKKIAEINKDSRQHRHPLTVSIGISCAPGSEHVQPSEIIEQADCALYKAKRKGRNRTEIFTFDDGVFPVLELFGKPQPQVAHA